MTTFEEHVDWFCEHLKQLGYVKVIRCKDCMHRKDNKCCYERKHIQIGLFVGDNEHCAWAERKEE